MSKIAFVFPGQGSQTVGMCKAFYDEYPVVKQIFEEADDALGYSISKMCFEGPAEDLKLTANTQPAILTASTACAAVLKEHGVSCDIAAGHSLGEYSALVNTGALKFADAVRIVNKRGQFMQEAVPVGEGSMAAILGLDSDKIVEICKVVETEVGAAVQAVNFNCPGQVVIAGAVDPVNKAIEALKAAGAKRAVLLPVSAPFHSTLMQPAADRLAEVLAAFTMGLITRTTRSNLLDVMSTDYIRTARAKGLSNVRLIIHHALGNALIPVLTVIGLGFGNLLGGMVLVETIFNWPGVGQFAYQSVLSNDYPSIIGVALLIALNYMIINTVVDILYGIIDPRVRCS